MMKMLTVTITIVDFRREQLLEEENEKIKIKTLVNRYYCNSSLIIGILRLNLISIIKGIGQ